MHKQIITAAANIAKCYNKDGDLVKTYTLVDCGHYCKNMQELYKLLRDVYPKVVTTADDQGFIDNSGNYYSREDAYTIAKNSGQPFNDEFTLPNNKLDSSCIRHFNVHSEW